MNMTENQKYNHSPFFDQEEPERHISGMIASDDHSADYGLDAVGVFRVIPEGFLVVEVSGCSCWPDRGSTQQTFCADRIEVQRELGGEWSSLYEACQLANWDVTKELGD